MGKECPVPEYIKNLITSEKQRLKERKEELGQNPDESFDSLQNDNDDSDKEEFEKDSSSDSSEERKNQPPIKKLTKNAPEFYLEESFDILPPKNEDHDVSVLELTMGGIKLDFGNGLAKSENKSAQPSNNYKKSNSSSSYSSSSDENEESLISDKSQVGNLLADEKSTTDSSILSDATAPLKKATPIETHEVDESDSTIISESDSTILSELSNAGKIKIENRPTLNPVLDVSNLTHEQDSIDISMHDISMTKSDSGE